MITSVGNARMKAVVQLRQRAGARRKADAFVAEGVKLFLEAPIERIREVYLSESFSCSDRKLDRAVADKLRKVAHESVSGEVFKRISDTCCPQGILCVMKAHHYRFSDMLGTAGAPLLLLLEDIQDPGNVGTMLRAGEGAGVSGVIFSKGTADVYNPKTVRATMGSIFRVPFLVAESMTEAIEAVQKRGIQVFAGRLGEGQLYDTCDYRGGSAFLIGNEGNGLKEETAARADCFIKIPMLGAVESLNAAAAGIILLYEAARQRRSAK